MWYYIQVIAIEKVGTKRAKIVKYGYGALKTLYRYMRINTKNPRKFNDKALIEVLFMILDANVYDFFLIQEFIWKKFEHDDYFSVLEAYFKFKIDKFDFLAPLLSKYIGVSKFYDVRAIVIYYDNLTELLKQYWNDREEGKDPIKPKATRFTRRKKKQKYT